MSQPFGNGGSRPGNRMSLAQEMLWSAAGGRHSIEEFSHAAAQMEGRAASGARLLVPPDLITAAQRVRVMTAMQAAVAELGCFDVTITSVTKRARIRRNIFYQYFKNKEHCFTASYHLTGKLLVGRMETAASRQGGDWEDRLLAAISELLYFSTYEPVGIRALLAGRNAAYAVKYHDSLLEEFSRGLAALAKSGTGRVPDEVMLDAVVGGVEYLLFSAVHRSDPGDLQQLAGEMAAFCARPIVGVPSA